MAQTLISQATGTPTSNGSGRTDKWYDTIKLGTTGTDTYLANPATSLNMRKDWGGGVTKTVTGFKAYSTSDQGFYDSGSPTVSCDLYGSSDASSWTLLGSCTPTTNSAGITLSKMTGVTTTTAYRYHEIRVSVVTNSTLIYVTEAEFYEGVNTGTNTQCIIIS